MKKIISFSFLFASLVFVGCTKNEIATFTGAQVEFDATTWNANAAGLNYPFLIRIPVPGIVTPASQPLITRSSGSVPLRINMVGPQKTTDTEFAYQVVATESTAVAGTHYAALSGKGTIPANSSFATVTVTILNPGAGTGTRDLVLQLIDNGPLKANTNYSKVGLRIAQN